MKSLVTNHSIVPDIGREEAAKMTQWIGRGAALTAILAAVAIFTTLGSIAGAQGNRSAAWMGEKVFDGKVGPWLGEARLIDPKAQVAEARSGGRFVTMPATYHLAIALATPRPKTHISVTEGKGTVTVTGPGGKSETKELVSMGGHFGADLALEVPGEYRFALNFESGALKGSSGFAYAVR
jgi:hypothetical protein